MNYHENYCKVSETIRAEYSKKYPGKQIFNDGILRPDLYFEPNKPRIVMLLKEGITNWSLVDVIDNSEKENYIIKQDKNNSSKCWAPNIIRAVHYMQYNHWLSKTKGFSVTGFAYINVKKVIDGQNKSDDKELDKCTVNDKNLLKNQILSCIPDIVFCCQYSKRNQSNQLIRLEKILDCKGQPIPKIPFAYELPYVTSKGKVNKLIAVSWSHPSFSHLTKQEMKRRLEILITEIKAIKCNNT